MVSAKDYATDQEVRWCPGCGDYSILKQVQTIFAQLELNRDETAIIPELAVLRDFHII
jgi:2-oxoglutarate ferredoxin oxidoreductase subunit beta